MKRVQSNIVNVGFTIMNAVQETKGKKARAQGLELTHATVNGVNAGVGIRTINGGQKSAQVNLDDVALRDLLTAVNEILAVEPSN